MSNTGSLASAIGGNNRQRIMPNIRNRPVFLIKSIFPMSVRAIHLVSLKDNQQRMYGQISPFLNEIYGGMRLIGLVF